MPHAGHQEKEDEGGWRGLWGDPEGITLKNPLPFCKLKFPRRIDKSGHTHKHKIKKKNFGNHKERKKKKKNPDPIMEQKEERELSPNRANFLSGSPQARSGGTGR